MFFIDDSNIPNFGPDYNYIVNDNKLIRAYAYCRVSTDNEDQKTNYDSQRIHYKNYIFYSFIFLIPALILSIKYKDNLFTKVGKWLSITFIGILLPGFIFMIV